MNKNRKEWEARIIAHAWKDPSFKKLLLSNPQEAMKQINCPVGADLNVKVIEEKENAWTIVLPSSPTELRDLTEADMKTLAGGTGDRGCCVNTPSDQTYCDTWGCGGRLKR